MCCSLRSLMLCGRLYPYLSMDKGAWHTFIDALFIIYSDAEILTTFWIRFWMVSIRVCSQYGPHVVEQPLHPVGVGGKHGRGFGFGLLGEGHLSL